MVLRYSLTFSLFVFYSRFFNPSLDITMDRIFDVVLVLFKQNCWPSKEAYLQNQLKSILFHDLTISLCSFTIFHYHFFMLQWSAKNKKNKGDICFLWCIIRKWMNGSYFGFLIQYQGKEIFYNWSFISLSSWGIEGFVITEKLLWR